MEPSDEYLYLRHVQAANARVVQAPAQPTDQDQIPTIKAKAVQAPTERIDQDLTGREDDLRVEHLQTMIQSRADTNAGSTSQGSQTKIRNEEISFIALLRGVACLLVVWDHLAGIWLDSAGKTWLPLTLVREYVTTPLAVIQDFGFFGVVLFFFVSGFIITHVAQRESQLAYVIKRLFRIYPPLVLSIIAIYVTELVYLHITGSLLEGAAIPSARSLFLAMTLTNYFTVPQVVINGVAWTLAIEVTFYALMFCLLPFVKKAPFIADLRLRWLVQP